MEDHYFMWKVIGKEFNVKKSKQVLCQCDCGTIRNVNVFALKAGKTTNCGCKRNHGLMQSHKRLYSIWSNIKCRCNREANKDYKNYGAKGIKLCKEWTDFRIFYKDMGDPPSDFHQIDRMDNSKGYNKENCRWVTPKENSANRSTTRLITYNGITETIEFWAKEMNINICTLASRYNKSKNPRDLFKEVDKRYSRRA